jgi:hypothetical protein
MTETIGHTLRLPVAKSSYLPSIFNRASIVALASPAGALVFADHLL